MYRIKYSIVLLLAVTGLSFPVLGACKPTPSNLDESFGVGQLGQPYVELLPTIKPDEFSSFSGDPRCARMDNTRYDCSFRDSDGITYDDVGKGLISKAIHLRQVSEAVLPFG